MNLIYGTSIARHVVDHYAVCGVRRCIHKFKVTRRGVRGCVSSGVAAAGGDSARGSVQAVCKGRASQDLAAGGSSCGSWLSESMWVGAGS
eukprot:1705473-Amphidinium_carterae.1